MIIRCCTVSNVAARPPHALRLAKEDVSHSAFGIIRTAVKMRVDRGIRFLGKRTSSSTQGLEFQLGAVKVESEY